MEKERIKNKYSIQYTIEYEDSVKIEDFTASLNALSFEYKNLLLKNTELMLLLMLSFV
jgi:hypothetical protein